MKPIIIIEHLEKELWPWCMIEYRSLAKIAGKTNTWFTNIPKKETKKLLPYGKVFNRSIKNLSIDLTKACILDPRASRTLKPTDSFNYYIFGGILGEEKLNGRTERELTQHFSKAHKRNLGKGQFSTDNAVFITKTIINEIPLEKIPIQTQLELKINTIESILLPYHYPIINNKPRISSELIAYLKKKKGF
jgi:ribosome biogenesis SPOUT family RNA methylase Rps3